MNFNEQNKEFEVKACMDLKQGDCNFAGQVWDSILMRVSTELEKPREEMDVSVVQSFQNLLLCAARCHKEDLFQNWLQSAGDGLCQLPFPKELGQFILNIAFVVGDRRMKDCLPNLQSMLKQYRRICQKSGYSLDGFLTEWLNFSAQMMMRSPDRVSVTFLKCYLRMLYFCTDWSELRKQLWRYYFYVQGFAQENGLEKTLQAYGLMDCLTIVLYERTLKIENQCEQRVIQSGLSGSISNWLLGMATVLKTDEMEVTDIWKQRDFTDDRLKIRFSHLCDSVIAYRQQMRSPKIQK